MFSIKPSVGGEQGIPSKQSQQLTAFFVLHMYFARHF